MNVFWALWKIIRTVAIAAWTLLYFVVLCVYAILNAFLDDQQEGAKRLRREMWQRNGWM